MKTKLKIVVIDESQYWKEDILKACGGKIETVYMYDASEATRCCEITPSYYLIPLYYVPAVHVSDEIHAELIDTFSNEEPMYVHCSDVDKLTHIEISALNNKSIRRTERNQKNYDTFIEEKREYFNCNHVY